MHGLPSVAHAVPLGLGSTAQVPAAVQTARWHSFGGAGQSASFWQHPEPETGVWTQLPVVGSQVSVVHGLPSSQSLACPGVQAPAWQVSLTVQGLPSSHPVPFFAGSGTHVPVVESHF